MNNKAVNPPVKFEEIVTVMINVFIFNKLDFQNCFLSFLTLKLCMNIKSLSKSQFLNCTISSKWSPLLETHFPLLELFAENPKRMQVLHQSYVGYFSQ